MDRISKFLEKLNKKQRNHIFLEILPKISNLNFDGLDIKPLKNYKNYFRVRYGNIRIVFYKDEKKKIGIISNIAFRKDAYKDI